MPDYSLANVPILDCLVTLQTGGCWTCDAITTDLTSPDLAAGNTVTLSLDTMQLTGTIVRGGSFVWGSEAVRIVGGMGGLGKTAVPESYNAMPWQAIVTNLLDNCGESLSTTVDASLLSAETDWTIRAEPNAMALSRMCDAIGCVWRVLTDGTVWLGVDDYSVTATLTDPTLMDFHPERGEMIVGIVSPELLPGQTIALEGVGGGASAVEYRIRGTGEYTMKVFLVDP